MSKERELKFKINESTTLTATKSGLQELIKAFDKPEWEIRKDNGGDISLNIESKIQKLFAYNDPNGKNCNLQKLSYKIANTMDDTLTWREQASPGKVGFKISYSSLQEKFIKKIVYDQIEDKHFKTSEKCDLAVKLLNESQDIKDLFAKWDKGSE